MIIEAGDISENLQHILNAFPHVRVATRDDALNLSSFIQENPMDADGMGISFSRGEDYFSLLEMQSEISLSLILEVNDELHGVGSLTCRKAYIRGKETLVGYLQDLRIATKAEASLRLEFFNCFTEIIRQGPWLADLQFCPFFYTAILDENHKALKSLSRSRLSLEYTRIFRYRAHVFPKLIPRNITTKLLGVLRNQQSTSWADAYKFYEENLGDLSYDLSLDDIKRLAGHSTVIGVRSNEKLAGVCLLVNSDGIRDLVLTGGKNWPKIGLKGAYISALKISKKIPAHEQAKIKRRLIMAAKFHPVAQEKHFLGYIQPEKELEINIPLPKLTTNGSVYRVFHNDHTKNDNFCHGFLRPNHVGYFDWSLS